MAKGYVERVYEQMRKDINDLSRETELEILKAYKVAGNDLVKKFRRYRSGSATRAYYASYTRALNSEMTKVINRLGLTAAEITVDVQRLMSEKIFKKAGIYNTLVGNFMQSYGKIPERAMSRIISGNIYKDATTLSSRIWGTSLRAGNDIQRVVTSGLANKLSASQMAKTLEAYVDSSVRRTWNNDKIRSVLGDGYADWNNNLEYNSLRLARTTITHASQLAHVDSCRANPYIKSVQWNSVFAHGRTCEICRERNGKIFLLDDVPLDHPNGLCYQTAVLEKSLDDIADDLKRRVDDPNITDILEDWG